LILFFFSRNPHKMMFKVFFSFILFEKIYGQTTSALLQHPFEISFSNVSSLEFASVYYDTFISVACEHFECDTNSLSISYSFGNEVITDTNTFVDIGFTVSGTSIQTDTIITQKSTSAQLSSFRTRIQSYTPALPTVVSINKETLACIEGQTLSFYQEMAVCTQLCNVNSKYNADSNTCTHYDSIIYTPSPTMAETNTIIIEDTVAKWCYLYGAGFSMLITFSFFYGKKKIPELIQERKKYLKKQQKRAKKAAKKAALKAKKKKQSNQKNKENEINADKFVYNDNDNSNDNNDDDGLELGKLNLPTKGEDINDPNNKQSIVSQTKVIDGNNEINDDNNNDSNNIDDDDESSDYTQSVVNEKTGLKETNQ